MKNSNFLQLGCEFFQTWLDNQKIGITLPWDMSFLIDVARGLKTVISFTQALRLLRG
jgi:hypothetical protein